MGRVFQEALSAVRTALAEGILKFGFNSSHRGAVGG